MLKYIIRLDDASEYMDQKKWEQIEEILDKYDIKPIVGIIPDNKDKKLTQYKENIDFWNLTANNWQKKGWIIAQHGLNHDLNKFVRSEYKNHSYDEQLKNLKTGNNILHDKNIIPKCFFAPAHTFDDNTIKACQQIKDFKFISDGIALFPYKYKEKIFLPNIFDTPHKTLPFGIYTFVYHPNNMKESDYLYLEKFIQNNRKKFDTNIIDLINNYENRRKNLIDFIIEFLIFLFRKIKGTKR